MSAQPFSLNPSRVRQPGTYAAPALEFDLDRELRSFEAEKPWQAAHTAKILVKHPDLRIVLVALHAGVRLQQHETIGRVSIQTLSGDVRVRVPGSDIELPAGHLLALDRDVPHEILASVDSSFLLTIAWPELNDFTMRPEPGRYRVGSAAESIDRTAAQPSRLSPKMVRIDEDQRARERGLDKTLADTFPCSDAFSSIPDPCLREA